MAIKMKFHTVEVHVFFSTNPQQPLFVGWGMKPQQNVHWITLSTCLTTKSSFGWGGGEGGGLYLWDFMYSGKCKNN